MATLDLVNLSGGKVANFVNLGGDARCDFHPDRLCERLAEGLNLIGKDPNVKAILVNVIGSAIDCELAAEVISAYVRGVPPSEIATQIQSKEALPTSNGDRGKNVDAQKEKAVKIDRQTPKLIVRLLGNRFAEAKKTLSEIDVPLVESLDDAIKKTVAVVK
jgi:succinyl-CoA synthetase beta subunit